uniref:Uncharacterized protein n=1 Tax=Picea glauca TaxID=3330 RepID=A0A101LZ83_PICGL|nr:hypothetical protein ABT39_MTgene5085 [Picea glauca]
MHPRLVVEKRFDLLDDTLRRTVVIGPETHSDIVCVSSIADIRVLPHE